MAAPDDLDPLELFQSEIKEDDVEIAMQAVKRLNLVALGLGPERTRNELLPFLRELADADNDELMAAVAISLGDFVPHVGGPPHGHTLLIVLEALCSIEETVVRDNAVKALQKIFPQLPPDTTLSRAAPLVRGLAGQDWFTSRVSACGLIAALYPSVPEQVQTELMTTFIALCNDDTPMVRSAAYKEIGALGAVASREHTEQHLMPVVKALSEDHLDSMRLFTVDACASLAGQLSHDENVTVFLPFVQSLHDDSSWRVRHQLAKSMPKLCKNFGPDASAAHLLPLYAKLVTDNEPAIRLTVSKNMSEVADAAPNPQALCEHLGPLLEPYAVDENEKVRIQFSRGIVSMVKTFGEPGRKILVPILQTLTRDEHSEVKNSVVARMDSLAEALGAPTVETEILPTLVELSKEPKWRVRWQVVGQIGLLTKHLGPDCFERVLREIVMNGLSDHVFAIREEACRQVQQLTNVMGADWAVQNMLPQALRLYDGSTNYLHRMIPLLIISNIASLMAAPEVENHLLPLVIAACRDDVANVRFAAAKTATKIIPHLDRGVVTRKLKPVLSGMAMDEDVDVQYFSQQALQLVE